LIFKYKIEFKDKKEVIKKKKKKEIIFLLLRLIGKLHIFCQKKKRFKRKLLTKKQIPCSQYSVKYYKPCYKYEKYIC
jgi:hypothetical protein